MKTIVCAVSLACGISLLSQHGDSLLDHWPLQVGNIWDYKGDNTQLGIVFPSLVFKTSIGDSVYSDGERYEAIDIVSYQMNDQEKTGALGYVSRSTVLQRVDSTSFNVYQIGGPQNEPYLADSLLAEVGDMFKMFPGEGDNVLALVDTSTVEVFGEKRKLRHLTRH